MPAEIAGVGNTIGLNKEEMLSSVNGEQGKTTSVDPTSPFLNPDMVVAETEPVRSAASGRCPCAPRSAHGRHPARRSTAA